ncbi:hypothetical protein BABINDRAFT_164827 [Babjeviella inositovora NRRL Y-12698]|uniref:Uncharacterized protein n=1 Tax=Babjeviella inositovora NRRL Y-12698 TaxID=984486 RepID=A0A1E3R181_9ASCO|nr:uncharacterized protein BABINDRAFT_164827 [Babjeviella inositovora NRRL Y-12698]ODQ83122.1 hypothetical protein BABINDRAFT_164827 [Babjeviella inositovora NRRL Y-12698]
MPFSDNWPSENLKKTSGRFRLKNSYIYGIGVIVLFWASPEVPFDVEQSHQQPYFHPQLCDFQAVSASKLAVYQIWRLRRKRRLAIWSTNALLLSTLLLSTYVIAYNIGGEIPSHKTLGYT